MTLLRTDERGSALLIALVAAVMLSALGLGLVTLTNLERAIAANYQGANEMLYAADAGVERAVMDIRLVPTWTDLLNGTARSGFVDGTTTPTGPGNTAINLMTMTAKLQAQSDSAASWGPNNPQWRLYAYGPLSRMSAGSIKNLAYLIVWIADDPSETDNDSAADTNGVITLVAQAVGVRAGSRMIEVTLAKTGALGVRILSWRELR